MKFFTIKKLQAKHGYDQMQELIDSGMAWRLEGAIGRAASDALAVGACYLPTSSRPNSYGGRVPSRYMVKPGTKGSWKNTVSFYKNIEL